MVLALFGTPYRFGQAVNTEVVTELMLNWLTCWYEGEALPSRGHVGPVHRCGTACPYRRAQSDYAADSWSLPRRGSPEDELTGGKWWETARR